MSLVPRKNRSLFDEDDPYSTDPFYKELDESLYGSEETQSFQVPQQTQSFEAPQQTTRYPQSRPDLNEFEKGFGAGVDQIQALAGGAKAALGSAFGNEAWVNDGLAYYQDQMREAMQYQPDVAFEDDWGEEGFVDGVSDFADWLAYTAGNVAPSLIGVIGTGGVTGFAAKKGAELVIKRSVRKQLEKKFENTAKDIAKAQLGKEARQEYVAKVAKKYAGTAGAKTINRASKIGSGAGGFVFSSGMGTGENFGRIYEETGLEDPGAALSLGIAMGALDLVGAPIRAFRKAFPKLSPDKLKNDLSQAALNDRSRIKKMYDAVLDPETRLGTAGAEVLKAGGLEGLTEATQEWLSRTSVLWAAENLSEEEQARFIDYLSSEDAMSSYLHAFAAGTVGGSMVGGPLGVVSGPSAKGRARRESRLNENTSEQTAVFSEEAEKQREQVLIDAREAASNAYEDFEPDLRVPEESETPTIPPALQPHTENTLDTIEFGAGVDVELLAQENNISLDDQQELLDTMESMGLISSEITPEGITYSVLKRPEEAPTVAEPDPVRELQAAYPKAFEVPLSELEGEKYFPGIPGREGDYKKDFGIPDEDTFFDVLNARKALEQKVDTGTPVQVEEGETQSKIKGLPTVEIPVDELSLSQDVPQFKSGANDEGVVEALGGKFDRTGVAPIIVWERKDGRKEVISGRHRLELAKRSGEKTIPSQVVREADGFTVQQAAILDAELNLRDGQGQVKDYVNYFQADKITKEEALSRGLLARATGKRAYAIATDGSEELITAHRNDQITDAEAEAVALNAPGNTTLQAAGLKALINGSKAIDAVNVMKAIEALDPNAGGGGQQDSMFAFDDSAMQTAEEMAKIVSAKQRQITADLSAITGASKKPEVAKKYGVNVKNAAALKKVIDGLKADRVAWENWHTNPALVAEINSEMTGDAETVTDINEEGSVRAQFEQQRNLEETPPDTQEIVTPDPLEGLTGMERERARFRLQSDKTKQTVGVLDQNAKYERLVLPLEGEVTTDETPIKDRLETYNQQDGSVKVQPNGDDEISVRSAGSYSSMVSKLTGIGAESPSGSVAGKPETTLSSVVDFYNTEDLDASPQTKTVASIILDSVERGVPPEAVEALAGVYIFEGEGDRANVPAAYSNRTRSLAIQASYLDNAANDVNARKDMTFMVSHELWHSIDNANDLSANIPGMRVSLAAPKQSGGNVQITLDEITGEIFEAYRAKNELGEVFNYPFDKVSKDLSESSQTAQLENKSALIRMEVFAQAGAVFASNPKLLKKFAPKAYKMMLDLQQDPSPLTREESNENLQFQTSESNQPQGEGVPGPIRAPPVDRGGEVSDTGTGGRPSGRGVGERGTDSGLAGQTQPEDGDATGRSVQLRGRQAKAIEQSSDPEFLEIVLADLSQPSQKVTASTILYGDEAPIQIEGKPTVVRVATALDQRVAEAYGDTDLAAQTDENVEIISDLIAHEATEALYQDGNAGEWYQEKVANAMSLAAQRFPELSTDPNAKFAFTAIMAVTSNGASVPENSSNTFKLYEDYRQTKRFKIFGVGKESQAMRISFNLLNDLIDATDVDSVRNFMDQDITVKELKEDFGLTVFGELMGTKLKGSAILGPKIGGGFYQNLNGNFNPLTMDRWFMRTYGRLTGTLMSEAKRKLPDQIDKFRKVALTDSYKSKLKKDGINRARLNTDDEYLLDYATKVQSEYAQGNFKDKNTLNKASNTLKNSQSEKQAPQNGTEREFIRRVMLRSLDKVNEKNSNNPVNMGALQAIIWYPEKQLYKVHGVGNARSEPTDYETEFRKIIEGEEAGQGVSGPDGSAQQPGSGDVQRGTVEPDENQEQDDGAAVQETSQRIRFKPGKPDLTPNPRIKRAYQDLQDGLITKQEYNEIVTLTVFPYEASPDPASVPEMEGALNKSQVNSINVLVEEGEVVGIRLDINAYENKGVWVSTIHMDKRPKGSVKKSYRATAAIKNVTLIQPEDEKSQRKAQEVMEGVKNKSPFAQIRGDFINRTDEENALIADEAINSPEWTQIGYDPRRRSMFYDRANGDPILFADEVVQIGPLVLGKNVKRGNIDDFQYMVLPSGNKPNAEFNLTDELIAESASESAVTRWFSKDLASKVVDKYNLWQTVEKAMAKASGLPRLPSEISFREAENLMHSKLQDQIKKFEEKYVKGFGELSRKHGLNVDQIGLYLLAKHAPERNAAMLAKEQERRAEGIAALEDQILSSDNDADVARAEGKLEQLNEAPFRYIDTGSGMTDAQAQKVLDNAQEAGNANQYEEIADKVYAMLDEMRQGMVDKGLLDEQSKADWEAQYQFYVPLKGFQDTEVGASGGSAAGFNIRGPESMKARGRVSLPKNPLLMAIKDSESKIIRAEKNRVAQRLLKLAEGFQSSEWTVYNNKFRPPSLDPAKAGEMQTLREMQQDINDRTKLPRYIQVKRGGQTFFIEFANDALARQLHQADPQTLQSAGEVMGNILKTSRKINNFRRKMIINYNPSWGLVNPIRDIETGLAFLFSEQSKIDGRVKGHKLAGKVFGGWRKSFFAYRRHELGEEAKNPEQQEIFKYIDEYIADGAPTGLATMKDLDELRKDVEKELGAQPMRVWGTDIKIAAAPDFRNFAKKYFDLAIDQVEAFNQGSENAIRLSTYIESRKAGIPRLDAASLAKDLTTNFNRKGEYSSQIDAMYLFFNAAIQGNVNMKDALVGSTSAKEKATLLGIKATRKLFYGLFAFGFGRTMMNIMMSEDDDDGESKYKDFNPFTLQSTATFMGWTPEDTAVGLPLPYGWGWVDNMGRIMAEQMMGIRDPSESAVDAFTVSMHHFSPRSLHAVRDDIGTGGAALQAAIGVAPDALAFVAEQGFDVNFFGAPVVIPTPYTDPPASSVSKRGTLEVFKSFASEMNSLTGGTDSVSGGIDISPDRIQHAFDWMLGGLGRFGTDAVDTAQKTMTPEDNLKESDFPISKRFYFNPSEYNDQFRYYDNRRELAQEMDGWKDDSKGRQALIETRKDLIERRSHGYYTSLDDMRKAADKKLRANRKLIRQLERRDTGDLDLRLKISKSITRLQERNQFIYDKFNKRYDELK